MRPPEHDEIKDLVASYVLGALAGDEAVLVRAHISSCDECMEEADSFVNATQSLALDVDEVPVPSGFAERVMAAALPEEARVSADVTPARNRFRWSILPVAAALTALLVFGGLVVSFINADSELTRAERALTALLHGDESSFTLKGPSGAVAQVVPTFEGAYLVAVGLREAPSNHVYQLWLMADGTPVSAGLFDGSDAVSIIETEAELDRFDGAAITVEPEGGSAQPTSEPILAS